MRPCAPSGESTGGGWGAAWGGRKRSWLEKGGRGADCHLENLLAEAPVENLREENIC